MQRLVLFVTLIFCAEGLLAQHSSPSASNLSRFISINTKNQRVEDVLNEISRGNFIFSYSGAIPKDSIVSVSLQHVSIRELLDKLFEGKVDYKENGRYIILRSTTRHFSIVPEIIESNSRYYLIEGYVIDELSGEKIKDVSVYEKYLLQSTLSDKNGYFKLRFRGEHKSIILTASKELYRDTSALFLADIKVRPEGYSDKRSYEEVGSLVERFGLGKFLISSRQRIQSLNIPGFLANSSFQASLLPGLSSHGMLSSQIVNKGSLNVLGGYTAGVDGAELAGLFNINKRNMQKLQIAGVLNCVGGSVDGIQIAGLMNAVLDSVKGVQIAGLINDVHSGIEGTQVAGVFNRVKKGFTGTQISGVAGLISGEVQGAQISGVINTALQSVTGAQVAGVINIAGKDMNGAQVGIFNYARRLNGWQVGLINVADTSAGYSLGILNLVLKGYHKVSLYSTEIMNANVSVKTGNAKLYSMLIGGMNVSDSSRIASAGFGLGHDFAPSARFSVNTELSSQFLYLGNWDQANILSRVQIGFQYRLTKGLRLFGGPSYSVYSSDPSLKVGNGYKKNAAPASSYAYSKRLKGWIGWSAGLTIF